MSLQTFIDQTMLAIKKLSDRLENVETRQSNPGALLSLSGWVTWDNQNPSLGILPANSYVVNVRIHVTEAFNSDGTDNLSVGYDADNVAFATNTAVNLTGVKTVTLGTLEGYNATARAVEAYYVNGGSEPTTGKAFVILEYYRVVTQP